MNFEQFWREHEQEIARRCYGPNGWASPHEIARVVFEIATREVSGGSDVQ